MQKLALLLCASLAHAGTLQIRVVEGEGAVYAAGSRAARGLTVVVSDEIGNPVAGATVSFRLPEEGPGGAFPNGSKSEAVVTKADGRASVWGMQWNKTPGEFQIRITAGKEDMRAGTLTTQTLSGAVAASPAEVFERHRGRGKWIALGVIAAGAAAAGGVVLTHSQTKSPQSSPTTGVQIGPPSIIIGSP